MMAEHGKRNGLRRGQAVVEFALVIPIFLLVLLAVVEFGRLCLRIHLITNASRSGARVASLPGNLEEDVEVAVDEALELASLETGSWSTEVVVKDSDGDVRAGGLEDAEQGDRVYVTVANDFEVVSGSMVPGLEGTLELSRTCVFRHE